MAKTYEIIDGKLEVSTTGDTVIQTFTREEVVGKKAEAQTKVDHLQTDLVAAQAKVTEWNDQLEKFDK